MSTSVDAKVAGTQSETVPPARKSHDGSEPTNSTVWSEVDRSGFPQECRKSQPWKDAGEHTDKDQPSRWNLPGRAWKKVMVTCEMIMDLGTNNT